MPGTTSSAKVVGSKYGREPGFFWTTTTTRVTETIQHTPNNNYDNHNDQERELRATFPSPLPPLCVAARAEGGIPCRVSWVVMAPNQVHTPPERTALDRFILWYHVTFALYMLEPWERHVFHVAFTLIAFMAVYTAWFFLPSYILNVYELIVT
eukprot:m.34147 g.34147  ORF g.34147 m.34147 type:complete len:153 (+) comp10638_c0_seq1:756-1214(+)